MFLKTKYAVIIAHCNSCQIYCKFISIFFWEKLRAEILDFSRVL